MTIWAPTLARAQRPGHVTNSGVLEPEATCDEPILKMHRMGITSLAIPSVRLLTFDGMRVLI